jgi:aspartate 1-decarboxylase
MGSIRLMRAKLHQVRVTQRRLDYIGSIAIDVELLERVGLLPLEEVEVVNIDNGQRWSTYLLPAERGSCEVCPNGGGALLCEPGQRLIIFGYEVKQIDELRKVPHSAKILVAGSNNDCVSLFEQILEPHAGGLAYRTRARVGNLPDQPDIQLGPQIFDVPGL